MPEEPDNPPEATAEEASSIARAIAPHKFMKAEDGSVRASDFKSYYSNQAGFMSTQYDVTLSFSRVGPDPTGKAVSEHQCSVSMSYEHAKALGLLLLNTCREHEKEFGPLYILPKGQQPTRPDTPKEESPEELKADVGGLSSALP